jgi:hypothetical protein
LRGVRSGRLRDFAATDAVADSRRTLPRKRHAFEASLVGFLDDFDDVHGFFVREELRVELHDFAGLDDDFVHADGLVELVREAKVVSAGRELEAVAALDVRDGLELLVPDDLDGRFDERAFGIAHDAEDDALALRRRTPRIFFALEKLLVADLAFIDGLFGFRCRLSRCRFFRDFLVAHVLLVARGRCFGRRGWRSGRCGRRGRRTRRACLCLGRNATTAERENEGNERGDASFS